MYKKHEINELILQTITLAKKKMAIFISYVSFILLPKVNPFSFKSWTPLLKVMRSLADLGWTKNLPRRYNGRNKFIPRAQNQVVKNGV